METREEKEAKVVIPSAPPVLGNGRSLRGGLSFCQQYLSRALSLPFSQTPSATSPWVLHHPLVGFLNLFTRLLTVPTITPLNVPSVSCQDPSQVNLGKMLENLQCLLAS